MAKRTTPTKRRIDPARVEAGRQLREKREAARIEPALMAHLLRCDPKTIVNYESGATEASGAVVFAYDNIERLYETRLGIRPSTWNYLQGSQDPLPFDDGVVVDLREHILNQTAQEEPPALYAHAN